MRQEGAHILHALMSLKRWEVTPTRPRGVPLPIVGSL